MWLRDKQAADMKRAQATAPIKRYSRTVATVTPRPSHGNARIKMGEDRATPIAMVTASEKMGPGYKSAIVKPDGRVLPCKGSIFAKPIEHVIVAPKQLPRIVDANGRAL